MCILPEVVCLCQRGRGRPSQIKEDHSSAKGIGVAVLPCKNLQTSSLDHCYSKLLPDFRLHDGNWESVALELAVSPDDSLRDMKPRVFKLYYPSVLTVPNPPGLASFGGLWGCPRHPTSPRWTFPAGKWESLGATGLVGVLECAQSHSAFPHLIPNK